MRGNWHLDFKDAGVIVGIFVGVIGGVMAIAALAQACERQQACTDTIEIISVMPGKSNIGTCRPDQTMTVEDRVQGAKITCTCRKEHR